MMPPYCHFIQILTELISSHHREWMNTHERTIMLNKIYRYNLSGDPKLGSQRTTITLSNENNAYGIRNFSIVETASSEPQVQWDYEEEPSARLAAKIRAFEGSTGHPDPEKRGFELTEEQRCACKWFGKALDTAWKEEKDQVPMNRRTQHACLLIGAGGTGKTTIILRLLLDTFVEYFPEVDGEDRYAVVTFSHAQGDAISNEQFRAKTAHTAVGYRVASLRNKHLGLKGQRNKMEKAWRNKILLVEDEVSLFPAMVQNMLLHRCMRSRQRAHGLNDKIYGETGELFGHMPIVLISGDFLQIKPAKEISLADDMEALAAKGRQVHPEHEKAQEAILGIHDVIHLTKSRRFLDEAMSQLMENIRLSRPETHLPEAELRKLRGRKVEKRAAELRTPLFADGHVVGIYWENIARSITERAHRDARKLDLPLYCLQAADRRATFKSKKHEEIATHALLTVPNIHRTGRLPGILLIHEGMHIRLSDVLAPGQGLVKDKLGKVLKVELDERDQRRLDESPRGYRLFVPEYMAKGVWVQVRNYKRSPWQEHMLPDAQRAGAGGAESVVFVELSSANFKCEINFDGRREKVEVLRWQFPLVHGKLRTAYAAQGLTLEGGVVVDLRRAGGMDDDDWWLAIYVMLSRARRLENLILVGLTEQVENLLRRGPPAQLIKVTGELEGRARETWERLRRT